MDLLRIVSLNQGNEIYEGFDVDFVVKGPVEELKVWRDGMPHLNNALVLHELNKKSIEGFALPQRSVVKQIADVSDGELNEWNASFFVFASRGPKLAVKANNFPTQQILAGCIELLVLGVDEHDVFGASLEKLKSQIFLKDYFLYSKLRE